MPSRHDLAVLRVSTWTVAFVVVALVVFKPPVLGFVLITLWMRLLLSDLHTALPRDFYESETEALRRLGVWFVLNAVSLTLATIQALAVWVGLDRAVLVPVWGWALLTVPGLVLWFLLVRHVRSAIRTLRERRPREAGAGEVLIHMLILPYFVLSSHHDARRAIMS